MRARLAIVARDAQPAIDYRARMNVETLNRLGDVAKLPSRAGARKAEESENSSINVVLLLIRSDTLLSI